MQAPWYNSYVAHQGEVNDMRDDLESILYEFGVDIVFAGESACSSLCRPLSRIYPRPMKVIFWSACLSPWIGA